MDIGDRKRIPRLNLAFEVSKIIRQSGSNFHERMELRQLVLERDWDTAKTLCHELGVAVYGDPRKFKSIVLEKLAQKGCQTIW